MKRLLSRLAIAAAALALLFVGTSALAYWLLDVDALVREQVANYEPEIERQLGREVTIGPIATRFFPTLGARIDGVEIAGAAADEGALLQVRSAGVDIDLLGVVLSFGKRISIGAIYLDGARVELVRRADGSLSFDDILARHPSVADPAGKKDEPIDPALLDLLQRVAVGEMRLADAEIRLIDRAAPGVEEVESVVRGIDLRVRDLRLGAPLTVRLRAAAFSEKQNIDLGATIGPIPSDLRIDGMPPLRDVHARIDALDLTPALPYLPLPLRAAVLSADIRLPRLAPGAPAALEGFVALQGLQLEGGTPIDIRLDADLSADLQTLSATIEKLRLQLGAVEIVASGALHDLAGTPRFDEFVVRSTTLDAQTLLAAFPAARAALPEGATVTGAGSIDLRASGTADAQTLALAIDLGAVDLLLPGSFAKKAGTPFSFEVEGDFTGSTALLRKARLRLDELDLDTTGSVRDFAAPIYDLKLAANPFSVDRLVRLLPQVAAELQASGAKAAGRGSLAGHLKGGPGKLSAELLLELAEVDLQLAETTVRGGLKTRIFAEGDPAGRLRAGLLVDAGQSVIRIPETLQKEAATPFVVDLIANKDGERLQFEKFDVRLAELSIEASGALAPGGDAALDLVLRPLDLEKFATTVPAVPAAFAKSGTVSGALRVRGNPAAPATMVVELQRFALQAGGSDLSATATVRNLEAPAIAAHFKSRRLDIDSLFPAGEEAPAAEEGGAEVAREDDPSLKALQLDARFEVARAKIRGRELENFRGRLVLRDGILRIEEASFGLYGGQVRATGTEAEIWRGAMPFKARLVAEKVDVGRLLAGEFDSRDLLSGRADLDVDLAGIGFDQFSLKEHLTGGWSLALQQGRLSTASITSAVVGGIPEVPGISKKPLGGEGELRDLLAGFTVENGRMNLKRPVEARLDGSRLALDGAVGIGGDLFLQGNYFVTPQLISKITGGRCTIAEEAAVPLRITGAASRPVVQPDGKAVGILLAKGCLGGQAKQALEKLAGPAATEALGKAEMQVDEAAARMRQEADAAKARADAEAQRLRKEADDKAKKKADEAAKKLKNRLGF